MLNETPANCPNASEVWEHLKDMVESLGAKPHCEYVSPVTSIPNIEEETEDAEIMVRENIVSQMIREMTYETFGTIDEAVMAEREEQRNLASKHIDYIMKNYRGLEAGFTMGQLVDWNQEEDELEYWSLIKWKNSIVMLQNLNTTELNGAEGIVLNTDDYISCGRLAISIKRPLQLAVKYNAGIKVKIGNLVAFSNIRTKNQTKFHK